MKSHNSQLTGVSDKRKLTVSIDANKSGQSIEKPELKREDSPANSNHSEDLSFSELDQIENVEQRFPTLDDLLVPSVSVSEEKSRTDEQQDDTFNPAEKVVSKNRYGSKPHQEKPENTEYEKKETWEKLKAAIDSEALKLADDIFAESAEYSEPMKPTKTNQSAISDASSKREFTDDNRKLDEMPIKSDSNFRKSFESGVEGETEKSDAQQFPHKQYVLPKARGEKLNQESPVQIPSTQELLQSNLEKLANIESPVLSSNNPPGKNPFPLMDQKFMSNVDLSEKKSANPWGDFRNAAPNATGPRANNTTQVNSGMFSSGPDAEVPTLPLDDRISTLTLNDTKKEPLKIEPNLIDLEVGLESSDSSIATPTLKPKTRADLGSQASLLNIDDDRSKTSAYPTIDTSTPMPQYKKRLSSLQLPSSLSFQEEVIDFASDDENPENGSKMNRLSIRNSLKKPKSRKSNEHKRSESLSEKKRLSFFGN